MFFAVVFAIVIVLVMIDAFLKDNKRRRKEKDG